MRHLHEITVRLEADLEGNWVEGKLLFSVRTEKNLFHFRREKRKED